MAGRKFGDGRFLELDVASAATCDIGAATTTKVRITGTTTITSFGTGASALAFVRMADSLTIRHAAASLILPGGFDIQTRAGDTFIAVSDPSGNWRVLDYARANGAPLLSAFGTRKIGSWSAAGNGSTFTAANLQAPSVTGTATARNVATTNAFTSIRRYTYVSAATAGASAGIRAPDLQFWRGNSPRLGGFKAAFLFGCGDAATVADSRTFVGFTASTAVIGNVNPSTLTNIIGLGSDNGAANLSILHNDGSGTATAIALGANFPAQTLQTDFYELALLALPNDSQVAYRVLRINTGDVASGVLTSDLPASTQFLGGQFWRNNGATALAVTIDVSAHVVETDF